MVWPTISGKMVESRDQVRSNSRRLPEFIATTRFMSLAFTNGPFFRLRLILRALPHNELVGGLAVAGLLAHGHLAPLRLRLTTDRRLTLTTAVRMVARVHGRAAHGRAEAHLSRPTGLANADRGMLGIADLAQRRHALDVHQAHFAGWQTHLRPGAFLGHQLSAYARAADHLPAASWLELDVVDDRADRDVAQRQCVAWREIRLRSGGQARADPH